MAQAYPDDLFEESTMTFGEHLEELRRCLFRALIGLVAGFLIGLLVGKYVVEFLSAPLEAALERYYTETAVTHWEEGDLPDDLKGGISADLIQQRSILPEVVYMDASTVNALVANDSSPPPVDDQPTRIGATEVLPDDIAEPAALLAALTTDRDASPAASAVWSQLTEAHRGKLEELAPPAKIENGTADASAPTPDPEVLAAALNQFINTYVYTPSSSLAELDLTREGQYLAFRHNLNGEGEDARLNRLLLEAAFPDDLVTTPAQFLPVVIWKHIEDDSRTRARTLNAQEGFTIFIKAAAVTGLVISSPWVFYWIWTFVAAGLYPHERRYIHVFLPFSVGLFLLGAATAFFLVFEPVLDFLLGFNRWLGLDPEPRFTEWLSFVLFLPIGFGISFQLPLAMLFLERIGIFSVPHYVGNWRISVLAIAVISMMLTPSDPYSMIIMAIPLTILYFGGILLCSFMPRFGPPGGRTDE